MRALVFLGPDRISLRDPAPPHPPSCGGVWRVRAPWSSPLSSVCRPKPRYLPRRGHECTTGSGPWHHVCVLQPPLSWWAPVGWTEGWWVGPGSLAQVTADKDNPCDPGRKEREVPSLWLGLLNWVWGVSQKSWRNPYPRGKRTQRWRAPHS